MSKEKLFSFGIYPEVPLRDAGFKRDEVRGQIAAGIDLGQHRSDQDGTGRQHLGITFLQNSRLSFMREY
jgi:hypothetical protein